MNRYRIVFRVEDSAEQTIMQDRTVTFDADQHIYERLSDALLLMAKLIKGALCPEIFDATPRT